MIREFSHWFFSRGSKYGLCQYDVAVSDSLARLLHTSWFILLCCPSIPCAERVFCASAMPCHRRMCWVGLFGKQLATLYSGNIHAHRPWSLKLWGWTKRCQAPSSTRLLPVTRYLLCTSSIARRSRIAHRQSYTASAFSKPLPVNWPLIISCCTRLTTKNPGVERASL